jgi:hypothetical protein
MNVGHRIILVHLQGYGPLTSWRRAEYSPAEAEARLLAKRHFQLVTRQVLNTSDAEAKGSWLQRM